MVDIDRSAANGCRFGFRGIGAAGCHSADVAISRFRDLERARSYFSWAHFSELLSVTIPGRIFDPKYTQLLIRRSDLPLADIVQLDRLQKGIRLDKEVVSGLRRKGLVEGRYPNVFPAGEVAAARGKTAEHLDAKAFDDDFYAHKILQFICQNGVATRSDILATLTISMHGLRTIYADYWRIMF